MNYKSVICAYCGNEYKKEIRRYNEAIKFKWKFYCSTRCQNLAKDKHVSFRCSNPLCQTIIRRSPWETPLSGKCYCSKSCAAQENNKKYHKRKKIIKIKIEKICPFCGKRFYDSAQRKYCSTKCYTKRPIFPAYKVIEEIKQFYLQNERIPFKREYHGYRAARHWFGTWNKAIIASGLDPNPLMFSKKYKAKDGHNCDSLSEKIIDDWLFRNKVEHIRNAPYPNSKYTFDFQIGSSYIEFFGLKGELKKYDTLMKKKLYIVKSNKIKLIKIYPKDIFPKHSLNNLLNELVS